MTKEKLEERIKLLETERDATKASLMAYEGAIQDCKHWLTQLEVPVSPEETPPVSES